MDAKISLILAPAVALGAWRAGRLVCQGVGDTADGMVLAGELPPFIIFGMESTDFDLMAADFLSDRLPYAEQHYRILEEGKYHGVGGVPRIS